MFKTNKYFDGKVKSLSYLTPEGPATIGVMARGEYAFLPTSVEHMTIISGTMDVLMPGEESWKSYKEFETFIAVADTEFRVRVEEDTAYRCYYR